MNTKEKNEWAKKDKENLKVDKKQKLTCLKCNNQTFLIVFGVADFPFFDTLCSKCGSGYPLSYGR